MHIISNVTKSPPTHLASSANAMIPDAIAVAAEVVENVEVHVLFRSDVIYERFKHEVLKETIFTNSKPNKQVSLNLVAEPPM